jgi:hypothetical protein
VRSLSSIEFELKTGRDRLGTFALVHEVDTTLLAMHNITGIDHNFYPFNPL